MAKIISETEVVDGKNKIIITEYENGARTHRTIRPQRPFYQRPWFYIVALLAIFIFFALLGNH